LTKPIALDRNTTTSVALFQTDRLPPERLIGFLRNERSASPEYAGLLAETVCGGGNVDNDGMRG